ncbi:MAG: hypothetical protein HY820_23435 [Acidobacteria bacterium]|nr:hypothetical protein [Acidobacteriota bacterium]
MRRIFPVLIAAFLTVAIPSTAQEPLLSRVTTSIASGQSLTGSIDLKDHPLIAIEMPASWTAATLTFQGSSDGTTWKDVFNMEGDEFTIQAAASRYIVLSPFEFQWARYIKIRSGTTGTPVNQGAARTLVVVTRRIL